MFIQKNSLIQKIMIQLYTSVSKMSQKAKLFRVKREKTLMKEQII